MQSQYFSMTCSIIYSGLAFQFAMPWASVVPALSYQRGNLAANCLPICRGLSEKDPNWQGYIFFFSPFPFASAARRGNWNWPMSYWVNIGPQSWRPPDCRAWSLKTPRVPAERIAASISFPWCRSLQLPPRFALNLCKRTLPRRSNAALRRWANSSASCRRLL